MAVQLTHGTVRESRRRAIHVLRVKGEILDLMEIEEIAGHMRARLAHRGEPTAEVVVVQGDTKETLRLYGDSYSVSHVRAALFNAAITFVPIVLGDV